MDIAQNYDHKRYIILNLINRFGEVSRTGLANMTGFRAAMIGDIIKGLLDERLIVESGSGTVGSGRGRKRRMLSLNKNYLCAVGVSVTDSAVSYILATIDGKVLNSSRHALSGDLSDSKIGDDMIQDIKALIRDFHNKKIIGIGIGDPGRDPCMIGRSHDFSSSFEHINDWLGIDLDAIKQEFRLPARICSRTVLSALAEQKFGVARGVNDFISFELLNGIGMSFCCNGLVVNGATAVAGQIGHTVVSSSEKLCYCGKPGCVDSIAALPALKKQILCALSDGVASSLNNYWDGRGELSSKSIQKALDDGDRMCQFYVSRSADLIGKAIANSINILNPQCIVLRGFMLDLGDFFLDALQSSIRANVLAVNKNVEIKVSRLTAEEIMPLGAAALIFSDFLKSDDFKWVNGIAADTEET